MKRNEMRIGVRLALLASLLVIASIGGQETSKDKAAGGKKSAAKADAAAIAELIRQLGSDDFQTRETASRQLADLDEVPDALRRVAVNGDREVSRRAQDAIALITKRVDERTLQAIVRDLHKMELDRFVRRMVTDKDFAGEKQWEIIQIVAKAVTAEANKIAGRDYKVPDFSANRMQRLLLNAGTNVRLSGQGSMLLSKGALPRITSIRNSLVIVDGDVMGATVIDNSLLIVRGNIGRVTGVTNSILLATGNWVGATGCDSSFVQVNNPQIRFTSSRDCVLLNTQVRTTGGTNSRVLKTEKGPLQLLKFSPRPTDAQLSWSKEVEGLKVALTPLDDDGRILIRWKNTGNDAIQLRWVRFQSNVIDTSQDDLLGHVFLKGPDGKLAPARKYPPPRRPVRRFLNSGIIIGDGRTYEETIDLWSYVEKPETAGAYRLSIELDLPAERRGMDPAIKTWSGKIQSRSVKVAVGK